MEAGFLQLPWASFRKKVVSREEEKKYPWKPAARLQSPRSTPLATTFFPGTSRGEGEEIMKNAQDNGTISYEKKNTHFFLAQVMERERGEIG